MNEYIEWAVWDQPVRSITDGSAIDYTIDVNLHTNALMLPDGSNVLSVATLGGELARPLTSDQLEITNIPEKPSPVGDSFLTGADSVAKFLDTTADFLG